MGISETMLQQQLRWDGSQWRVRVVVRFDEIDLVAVLATHADRFGGSSGPDLAPDEIYDRIATFLLTYGRDAVQDTLTLSDEAVGWAQRQVDRYRQWASHEEMLQLAVRPRPRGRPRRLAAE